MLVAAPSAFRHVGHLSQKINTRLTIPEQLTSISNTQNRCYRFQDKDFGCVIGRDGRGFFKAPAAKGLSPPCCLPKIIILKAISMPDLIRFISFSSMGAALPESFITIYR